MGGLAILVAAYVMLVWLPNRNRLLLEHDLKKFALLYHEFNDAHGRPPSTLADLESFMPKNTINAPDFYRAPRAFEMVRNNRFLVLWDAVLLPDGDANDKYVLGYEPESSEVGGLVMRAGGTVRYLTASEFNALPKIRTLAEK
ncbi:MAG: hypothetical protein HY290_15540 [Planctomycetia bacterium]|nr:hypothetical protein [Planctomycetia bacterium]